MTSAFRRHRHVRLDSFDANLSAGRYDLLGGNCSFPLALFLGDQQLLLGSRVDGAAFFGYFHAAMLACGLSRLSTRVIAEEIRRRNRFRLWIEFTGDGAARGNVALARAILYCDARPEGDRIAMIEFYDQRLPTLDRIWPAADDLPGMEDQRAEA